MQYDKVYTDESIFSDKLEILQKNKSDSYADGILEIPSHILTSAQYNLFVNKYASNITYSNLSDYRLKYNLKLDKSGIWNNNGIAVSNPINIETNNLIEI